MRSITVDVAGQAHTIHYETDVGYVRALASVVDSRVRDIQKASSKSPRPVTREATAVLVHESVRSLQESDVQAQVMQDIGRFDAEYAAADDQRTQ